MPTIRLCAPHVEQLRAALICKGASAIPIAGTLPPRSTDRGAGVSTTPLTVAIADVIATAMLRPLELPPQDKLDVIFAGTCVACILDLPAALIDSAVERTITTLMTAAPAAGHA